MISIIIPAHNEKRNLEELLPLLSGNGHDGAYEIIVAESCKSADDVDEMAALPFVRFLKCQNQGRAAQMNEAAKVAKGCILAFLHADVRPPKTFLSDIKATIDAGFESGFFSYRFDKKNKLLQINASFTSKDGIFTGGGDQCLFIKKEVFNALGAFDEKQVLMEDFEFFDRMKKNKVSYKIIKNDLVVSARKYEQNSYVRVNLSNLLLVVLFKLGYPPKKLKSLHNRLIRA
ncbi:glycosyltransferase [Aggregatimonas sangjinii]|uniref:Glycosyltransferase n=1 Tax=Aggregatimonas sangjinii TaxID=2583587 RepID=A0A5B7SU77_9FLAO|nr:TIGR04283 family arsenosugar biosynthesis glycosyltransferase [Aggregatimonas sangjinii]QCX00430.1 glycosyltransferase [Aggregatimonas sangjinii]